MKLINGDCITEMQNLINEDIQVDLILTDPPYGTVKGLNLHGWKNQSTEWDESLPTQEMFRCCEKLLRVNGDLILFSQEPYTNHLRSFKPENLPFLYPLIWEKNHFANSFTCNKAPVSYFEDISVFRKKHDSDNKHPLREYAQNILCEIGKTYKEIEKDLGHRKAEHFFYRTGSSQFSLCTNETYNELINTYHINELSMFKSYSELEHINSTFKSTFNLPEGKKVKSNIFKYSKDTTRYHPTQKPVLLLEDLLKTYTNKGDVVLDFTMGSGSTGVACVNTGRGFIGIELDKEYYNIAEKRIKEVIKQPKLI